MNSNHEKLPRITATSFGKTDDEKEVLLYSLFNENGMRTDITNYGGIVVRLFAPDKNGDFEDVVLGYDKLQDYIDNSPFFGALVGRYGNRIDDGEFTLGGKIYKLKKNSETNNIPCHLHGGEKGFDKVVWEASPSIKSGEAILKLKYLSPDGEEGYPGNLNVEVIYSLTTENSLRIEYKAETDRATPVNLTHHSYFNLKAKAEGDILDHYLKLNAEYFTPVNKGLIPTGEIRSVKNSPFDFLEYEKISDKLDMNEPQIKYGGGFDHNWVLNHNKEFKQAAVVFEEKSERRMEVWTTEPGIQFYCGSGLNEDLKGKNGSYDKYYGLCLETQHYPDSPHYDNFPSTILKPGDVYESVTEYKFDTGDGTD